MSDKIAEEGKLSAAKRALSYVKDDMTIGLGTGSTTAYFLRLLSEQVCDGLAIVGIPTSKSTEKMARKLGIKVATDFSGILDADFDGADEVDSSGNLVKGGGGALTREKIIASNSRKFIVLVDDSKLTEGHLSRSKIPVEILPFMAQLTLNKLKTMAISCEVRKSFTTDNGNYIVDCNFGKIDEPGHLESQIKMIPGVVEVGLFVKMANKIIVGSGDSSYELNY
ncbi:MAG: ribose-5-phosphate isomerase RpiA [Candidatus Thermoplasmatota archaeon]|nr:ribose-5-phosphate isomerase RpiA [Candidatus Thermoplasmatota archaeon]